MFTKRDKPIRITSVRISAIQLYFPTYILSKNYLCIWTETDGVQFNVWCKTLEEMSPTWSWRMMFERGLKSGYVTTLAHAYVITVGALNVILHFVLRETAACSRYLN
jgi:hypothetical protein